MTEHYPYGAGEVDDRIALAHRTSADLDASVRAFLDDHIIFIAVDSVDPDAADLLERDLWDANRDQPDPDTHEQKDQPDQ